MYIGSTNNHVKRWKQHQEANEDMPLHRAIKELGKENFKFEIIKEVDFIDEDQLLIHEFLEGFVLFLLQDRNKFLLVYLA